MSGIIAILHEDRRPIRPSLMHRLVESLAKRGPDALGVRIFEYAGLGHAMLRTTFEAERETQPMSLDGKVWITADARIDDRGTLRNKLERHGRSVLGSATDPELILHAYHAWATACVEQLIGDFAFVIWDETRARLFSARDHFGVKPLLYSKVGRTLIISNTQDTIRLHPNVTDTLNELTVGDHLLFDYAQEADATAFSDIRRIPAAHTLAWEKNSFEVAPYWTLPREETLRYKDDRDYFDHFHTVLGAAVGDRLRCGRVAINMSGGLDSTTLAATALRVGSVGDNRCRLKAFTIIRGEGFSDDEQDWARKVADYLDIPIHFTLTDDYPTPLENAILQEERESGESPKETAFEAHSRAIQEHSRVLLTGFGGDPVNRGSSRCYLDQLESGRFRQLVMDIKKTLQMGKRPPLHIRTLWRHWQSKKRLLRSYPSWLNVDFERRLDLRDRFDRSHKALEIGWSAHAEISSPFWPILFQAIDPGDTGFRIENRHPFFDLRVVAYMLRVPALPWFLGKVLMRKAMAERLPESVLARPKAFADASAEDQRWRARDRKWWLDRLNGAPEIARFVDVPKFLEAVERYSTDGTENLEQLAAAIGLCNWLRTRDRLTGASRQQPPPS